MIIVSLILLVQYSIFRFLIYGKVQSLYHYFQFQLKIKIKRTPKKYYPTTILYTYLIKNFYKLFIYHINSFEI
jgi:hypothetical protein